MPLVLSGKEQRALGACSETLLRPLTHASVDDWRVEVLGAVRSLIDYNAAFFNFRGAPPGVRGALSPQFSDTELELYERLCINDVGYERAREARLTVCNQTQVVGEDWAAYNEDPAVRAFYAPHELRDSLILLLEDPGSGLTASLELHCQRYGTPNFARRGNAILALLMPSFRAGLAAVSHSRGLRDSVCALLDGSSAAVALFDLRGRLLHRTPRLVTVLEDDSERQLVLDRIARLARAAGDHAVQAVATGPTAPCSMAVNTRTAAYRIEATRVAGLVPETMHVLVALERLTAQPVPDDVWRDRFHLSDREIQVARQIATGIGTREIAAALDISVHTARRHSERVFQKLGVHTRAAAAATLRDRRPN